MTEYTMDTCPACEKAAAKVSHEFRMGCRGCAARSIVRGPHFKRVQLAGMQDRQYRGALAQLGVTHEEVRAQAAVDMLLRVQQRQEQRRATPAGTSTDAPARCTADAQPSAAPAVQASARASQPRPAQATP